MQVLKQIESSVLNMAIKTLFAVMAVACLIGLALLVKSGQEPASLISPPEVPATVRYLPLGDSYTIGQGVAQTERWPDQLVSRLKADGIDIDVVANPSVTGFTSQNLIDRELPLLATLKPDFVTVLIGVNDYVRGIPESTFVKNLRHILDSVAKSVDEKHIVLVTIPDYTRTPTGQRFGNATEASRTIDKFNQAIIREAESRGILVVDIFQISQMVTDDSSLTASDGLHPSGKQYKLWSDRIYQEITDRNLFH